MNYEYKRKIVRNAGYMRCHIVNNNQLIIQKNNYAKSKDKLRC